MPSLQVANLPGIQPTVSTQVLQGSSLGVAADALRGVSGAVQNYQQASATAASATAKQANAAALGGVIAEEAGDAASFLEESVQRKQAGEVAQQIIDDGGHVGDTGEQVLLAAHQLKDTDAYLRDSGQMSTLNELRLLRKKQQLVSTRPDLGEDILRVVDATNRDTNTILRRNEEAALAEAAAERTAVRTFVDKTLQDAKDFNPREPFWQREERAGYYQEKSRRLEVTVQALASRQRQDQAEGYDLARDERAQKRVELEQQSEVTRLAQEEYVPQQLLGMQDYAMKLAKQQSIEPSARLTNFDQRAKEVEADIIANIQLPAAQAAALATFRGGLSQQRDLVSGKQLSDAQQAELAGQRARALVKFNKLAGDESIAYLDMARILGPAINQLKGAERGGEYMDRVGAKLMAAVARTSGEAVDDSPIRRRRDLPDYGSGSPYTLDGQQPSQVSDSQVKEQTAFIMDGLDTIARQKIRGPGTDRLAARSVVVAMTDPVVLGDRTNANQVFSRLVDPAIADAFKDNPARAEALEAAITTADAMFVGTNKALEKNMGKPIKELGVWVAVGDGIRFSAFPGTGVPMEVTRTMDNEANTYLRAIAHVGGGTDYARVASYLVKKQ